MRALLLSLSIISLVLVISSCDRFSSSKNEESSESKDTNIRKTYYPSGKVHKEMVLNNGTKTGVSREYYQNGKVFQEVNYQNNLREGLARRYYETGVLSQETPYKNDRMHGIQKKYRRSGKLMAEIPYYEGHLCIGLKEYTIDDKLKKRYPEIEITPINNILKDNQYILEVRMSDGSRGVDYYTGKLVDGLYIKEELNTIGAIDGVARIYFSVGRGDIRMEEVNIIVKVKTAQSNYYITQKSFHLAVENRF